MANPARPDSPATATPLERYRQDLARDDFSEDAAQAMAIEALDALFTQLVATERRSLLASALERLRGGRRAPVRGLYLWGGVGRGKTYMMDLFFECLPMEDKLRMHFHRFMRRVHRDLGALVGRSDPLQEVADGLARDARVLCFDEFFVSDITDAMILAELLDALFARGVTLVATSNLPPAELYRDGLQRRRFLPAIELLERHTRVLHVDGATDFRLRLLEQAEIFHTPLDDEADASLQRSFLSLAPEAPVEGRVLEVEQRPIRSRWCADDVVWFDFPELCDGPRSQNDYIELAREFHAVLVSNVPVFDERREDQARRFISLVDEFYDRNVKLILSAAAPVTELYRGSRLTFEFERTASRLLEMQSTEYLGRSHRA